MTASGQALPTPAEGANGEPLTPQGSLRPADVESALAGQVQDYLAVGNDHAARDVFAQIVTRQQRRASRIAWHYLRDVAEADEAVQDAFVKAYTHIASFQRHLSFEVWLTRILINGCLDLRKARARRLRWVLPIESPSGAAPATTDTTPSVEEQLISRRRLRNVAAAVAQLPERQRAVFALRHFGELTPNQISRTLGLSEATVRVHLFRAIRKLRRLLERG